MSLTKEVQDLYNENYNTLLKVIKEDINKVKDISYPWTRGLNIV